MLLIITPDTFEGLMYPVFDKFFNLRITILISQNITLQIKNYIKYSNTIIFFENNIFKYNGAIAKYEIISSMEDILKTDRFDIPEKYWPFLKIPKLKMNFFPLLIYLEN